MLLLLLPCARASVCVQMCNHVVGWVVGEQISFE